MELDVLNLTRGRRGNMFGALLDGNLLALTTNMGTGLVDVFRHTVLWGAQQTLVFPYPPELAAGMVFAGCQDSNLYAFNAANGKHGLEVSDRLARLNVSRSMSTGYSSLAVTTAICTGSTPKLERLCGSWQSRGAAAVRSFLYVNGLLFVVSNAVNGAAYAFALNIDNGQWMWTQKWQSPLMNGAQAVPVTYGNNVYFTGSASIVKCLDIYSGNQVWSYTPTRVAFAGPAMVVPTPQVDTSALFSQVCWLGTHNAFANSEDGWWYAQQSQSIISQLDDGVRMLMLDIWNCPSGSHDRVVYAHEGCNLSWLLMPFSSYILFTDSLAEMKDWLYRNPNEIVTIDLEQRVEAAANPGCNP